MLLLWDTAVPIKGPVFVPLLGAEFLLAEKGKLPGAPIALFMDVGEVTDARPCSLDKYPVEYDVRAFVVDRAGNIGKIWDLLCLGHLVASPSGCSKFQF
jgi:hypothetical protein